MPDAPLIDPSAPIQFVINAASGSREADAKRQIIEPVLRQMHRCADLHFCEPAGLAVICRESALRAWATHSAVVAVGGDGTLNAVAQAAHALGCAMGVVPMGTFNYFAREHGLPTDPADAVRALLASTPVPVQVAAINERIFLVNASLGLYPELLENREAFTARFGRSRGGALWSAAATLLRAQQRLRLDIERAGVVRRVRTLTLFVGSNRLQLAQLGVEPPDPGSGGVGPGHITAVMLRPVGLLTMIGLMLRGALGTLGEAQSVERFEFEHMVVRPTLPHGRRGIKVAFDGEVARMRTPLDFHVLARPLYLLRPSAAPMVDESPPPPEIGP